MPYFKFTASTPYCGEELEEYIEIDEDSLADADNIAAEMAREVADMFWAPDEEDEDGILSDGCYTEEEYRNECGCSYVELSKEEFEESR